MCFHLLERCRSSSLPHNSLFLIWLFQALTVFSSFLREAWNIFLSYLCACAAWVTGQVIKKLLTSDSATVHLFCFNINSPSVALWHPLSNFCTLFSIRNMASVCSCLLIIFFCLDLPWLVLMSASDFFLYFLIFRLHMKLCAHKWPYSVCQSTLSRPPPCCFYSLTQQLYIMSFIFPHHSIISVFFSYLPLKPLVSFSLSSP